MFIRIPDQHPFRKSQPPAHLSQLPAAALDILPLYLLLLAGSCTIFLLFHVTITEAAFIIVVASAYRPQEFIHVIGIINLPASQLFHPP